MTEETYSPEEQAQIMAAAEDIKNSYPTPEDKLSIFKLFNKIFETDDTTKVANLKKDELQVVRNIQSAALTLEEAYEYEPVANYFRKKAEIVLATSLSRDGALLNALITQKRQLSTEKKREVDSKWNKKKL